MIKFLVKTVGIDAVDRKLAEENQDGVIFENETKEDTEESVEEKKRKRVLERLLRRLKSTKQ